VVRRAVIWLHIMAVLALLSGPYRWAVAIRSSARRVGQAMVHLGSALAGHVSGDATVTWVRRHLHLLRIGGAVIAALALLIFSVNWIGFLIIAALLALYEYGLHRLRQPQPASEPSAPPTGPPPPGPAAPSQDVSAAAGTAAPAGPGGRPGSETTPRHHGHTHPAKAPGRIHPAGQRWTQEGVSPQAPVPAARRRRPGTQRARHQLNDYAPSPAGRFAPPGWCC
jgi:hypothetical protein